jgi:ligand-binding SRPBCC domain-containing protein
VAGPGRFEIASRLEAPAAAVWDRATSFEGINDELRPLLRMTAPPEVRRLDPEQVVLGERICRSWVFLLGVLPFDYDDIVLVALDPGRGFHEHSKMLSMRSWQHERWIEPGGEAACTIHDRLTFEPRLPLPGSAIAPVVGTIFRHRHRRLRRRFGGGAATGPHATGSPS